MPNLVVLFGAPASGKAAIGQELAYLTGYRFFHNHLTADPAAALFGWGDERFGRMVGALREILFREALSDPSVNGVIFTYAWGLNLPEDTAFIEKIAGWFSAAGGNVFFVELQATLQARIAREGTPFRVGLKPELRDAEAARARQRESESKYKMNTDGELPLPYPHVVINTEVKVPKEAATEIVHNFRLAPSDLQGFAPAAFRSREIRP